MVFSSLLFLTVFLPITVALYFFADTKVKNYFLLIVSLIFYSYGEPKFVFVMLAEIIIDYIISLYIDKTNITKVKNTLLVCALTINIAVLFVFKYLDFSIGICNSVFGSEIGYKNIALPIGISFFTFQSISYVIDVYKGKVGAQKNPFFLALYISFFPQLIAGPIVRYSTIEQQINNRETTIESFKAGITRFVVGLTKKILLANNLSIVAENIFGQNPTMVEPTVLWIGSLCYSLQIFFDFSGYSDMAIGLGKIFGFYFEENFDYPYISKSVTEFWRRWHMSLGQWFRDYVYIPLGGSKVKASRHIFNMFVVWALTGIWHGANYTFIVWGMMYFVLLIIEKYIIKPWDLKNAFIKAAWFVFTLLTVNFGWVIFNSPSLGFAETYILGMFARYNRFDISNPQIVYYFREYGCIILIAMVLSTPIIKNLLFRLENGGADWIYEFVKPVGLMLMLIVSISYLIMGQHNPFIYFNF